VPSSRGDISGKLVLGSQPAFELDAYKCFLSPFRDVRCKTLISRSKTKIFGSSRRNLSRAASPTPEELNDEVKKTAVRIGEVWREWEKEEDAFEKRRWGKDLIDLYGTLLKRISSIAKDEMEFEYLATLNNVPSAQTNYRLGVVYAQRFESEKAIEHLQKSVELDPSNYTHYLKFGELLHSARMYGSAVNAYTTMLTTMNKEFKKIDTSPVEVRRPASFEASIFQRVPLKRRMEYPHSKLAEVLYRRAHSQLAQHELDLALADWKTIIGLEPNHRTAESWAYLAHLSRIHGKWQQTIDLATKALEFDSELLIALYERSLAHFVLKNEPQMKQDNRSYAILAHERMWGLSNHPVQPDWSQDSSSEDS
jgi:tetratricopeptide (TPR) repeat protein